MAKIRPLQDRVIIRRIEEGEQIRGGIIIPDSAREKPQEGEVIAVGAGKKLDSGERLTLDVTEGDRVLFGKYAGTEVKLDDEDYLIMREDDILGVIEKAAASEGSKAKAKGR
ncbi:MAG: co-chaperone GroES [Blastocatellia bacterium]